MLLEYRQKYAHARPLGDETFIVATVKVLSLAFTDTIFDTKNSL